MTTLSRIKTLPLKGGCCPTWGLPLYKERFTSSRAQPGLLERTGAWVHHGTLSISRTVTSHLPIRRRQKKNSLKSLSIGINAPEQPWLENHFILWLRHQRNVQQARHQHVARGVINNPCPQLFQNTPSHFLCSIHWEVASNVHLLLLPAQDFSFLCHYPDILNQLCYFFQAQLNLISVSIFLIMASFL